MESIGSRLAHAGRHVVRRWARITRGVPAPLAGREKARAPSRMQRGQPGHSWSSSLGYVHATTRRSGSAAIRHDQAVRLPTRNNLNLQFRLISVNAMDGVPEATHQERRRGAEWRCYASTCIMIQSPPCVSQTTQPVEKGSGVVPRRRCTRVLPLRRCS